MQKLLRNKGKEFEWNEEDQAAFAKIKRELCENGMGEQFSVPLHMAVKC